MMLLYLLAHILLGLSLVYGERRQVITGGEYLGEYACRVENKAGGSRITDVICGDDVMCDVGPLLVKNGEGGVNRLYFCNYYVKADRNYKPGINDVLDRFSCNVTSEEKNDVKSHRIDFRESCEFGTCTKGPLYSSLLSMKIRFYLCSQDGAGSNEIVTSQGRAKYIHRSEQKHFHQSGKMISSKISSATKHHQKEPMGRDELFGQKSGPIGLFGGKSGPVGRYSGVETFAQLFPGLRELLAKASGQTTGYSPAIPWGGMGQNAGSSPVVSSNGLTDTARAGGYPGLAGQSRGLSPFGRHGLFDRNLFAPDGFFGRMNPVAYTGGTPNMGGNPFGSGGLFGNSPFGGIGPFGGGGGPFSRMDPFGRGGLFGSHPFGANNPFSSIPSGGSYPYQTGQNNPYPSLSDVYTVNNEEEKSKHQGDMGNLLESVAVGGNNMAEAGKNLNKLLTDSIKSKKISNKLDNMGPTDTDSEPESQEWNEERTNSLDSAAMQPGLVVRPKPPTSDLGQDNTGASIEEEVSSDDADGSSMEGGMSSMGGHGGMAGLVEEEDPLAKWQSMVRSSEEVGTIHQTDGEQGPGDGDGEEDADNWFY